MEITKEEFELIEKRFEAWNENIINCCIGGIILHKDEMIEHIKAEDKIGEELAEVQLHYLRKLKERK